MFVSFFFIHWWFFRGFVSFRFCCVSFRFVSYLFYLVSFRFCLFRFVSFLLVSFRFFSCLFHFLFYNHAFKVYCVSYRGDKKSTDVSLSIRLKTLQRNEHVTRSKFLLSINGRFHDSVEFICNNSDTWHMLGVNWNVFDVAPITMKMKM